MKILLVGNLPEDRQESMQRFTQLLATGLARRGHSVEVLTPTLRVARWGPRYRYQGVAKYLGYFDKYGLFPRRLRQAVRRLRPDVVHVVDHGNAPYVRAVAGTPVVVTCHDVLQMRAARGELPQQPVGWAGRRQQAWILRGLDRADHVACVSEATRADLVRLGHLPEARVSVIPNALNYPYQPLQPDEARSCLAEVSARAAAEDKLLNGPGGFVLHVGGGQWYKNRPGLLAIFAELRRHLNPAPLLVMVGPSLSPADRAQAAATGAARALVSLGDVSNRQLQALYSRAEGLIFPSWAEGFGWPVAEAQACGCPVFASNRAPLTEVGGAAAVYFDPQDPAEAARIIATAWPDRAVQRDRGFAEARRWDASRMLEAYEAVYRNLLR